MKTTLCLFALLVAAPALAATQIRDEMPNQLRSRDDFSLASSPQLRLRTGLLGRIAQQPTMFELAAGFDTPLPGLPERMLLDVDLTLGLRLHIVHLIPMAGIKYLAFAGAGGKMVAWGDALVGANLGFYRGSFGLGIPIRLGGGAEYFVLDQLGVGLDVGFDLGPLVAPFGDFQGAVHVGATASYRF